MSGSFVSPEANDYIFGRFCGEMYRERDNKCLGPIVLESDADQLKVYCNYLFGKENVYSKRYAFGYSHITYKAPQFSFNISVQSASQMTLKCNGFVAKLNSGNKYDEKDFFRNKTAIKNPDHYLVGNRYKGTMKFDASKSDLSKGGLFMASTFGAMELEMYFIDEETVRYEIGLKSNYDSLAGALFSMMLDNCREVKTHSYYFTPKGTIHWSDSELDWEDLTVLDHGKRLAFNNKEAGVSGTLEIVN